MAAGDRMDGKSDGHPVFPGTEEGPGNGGFADTTEAGQSDTSRTSPANIIDSLALPGTNGSKGLVA
jgi:hypothetical protein